MLQDLDFGRLENEFHNIQPQTGDTVICFQKQQILLKQGADVFPTYAEVSGWVSDRQGWFADGFRYVFRMQDQNYFLWLGELEERDYGSFHFVPVRTLREMLAKEYYYSAMTAWHLFVWYRNNRFCGCCGSRTVHDAEERMLRCKNCGNMIFPRISPAVIVGITDGDRLDRKSVV